MQNEREVFILVNLFKSVLLICVVDFRFGFVCDFKSPDLSLMLQMGMLQGIRQNYVP